MITGKQVQVFKDYYNTNAGYIDVDTLRKALEVYEASKWVQFDVNDESTYPPLDQVVMCKPFNEPVLQMSLIHDTHPQFDGFFFEDVRGFYTDIKCIAYWQPLPEFKE